MKRPRRPRRTLADLLDEVRDEMSGSAGRSTQAYRLTVSAEGAEPYPPGWHDELVAHTIRRNSDGSITAICLINLYDDQKNCYTAERVIRLEKE